MLRKCLKSAMYLKLPKATGVLVTIDVTCICIIIGV